MGSHPWPTFKTNFLKFDIRLKGAWPNMVHHLTTWFYSSDLFVSERKSKSKCKPYSELLDSGANPVNTNVGLGLCNLHINCQSLIIIRPADPRRGDWLWMSDWRRCSNTPPPLFQYEHTMSWGSLSNPSLTSGYSSTPPLLLPTLRKCSCFSSKTHSNVVGMIWRKCLHEKVVTVFGIGHPKYHFWSVEY